MDTPTHDFAKKPHALADEALEYFTHTSGELPFWCAADPDCIIAAERFDGSCEAEDYVWACVVDLAERMAE